MVHRTAFLARWLRILPTLLCVICFLAFAEAQHGGGGGGGGHSGGGHSSGGHSSGSNSSDSHSGGSHGGGHFSWLHFAFGKHSARHAGVAASPASDTSPHPSSYLWNLATPGPSISRIPSTLLWSPRLFPPGPGGRVSLVSSSMHPHRAFFNRFPRFSSSGCFWNGITQACFFEPFSPLLFCSADFGFFDSGFGGDSLDPGDGLNSQGLPQSEMSAVPPPAASDDDSAVGNSPVRPGFTSGLETEERDPGKGVFLLVLNNGASRAVIDYWVADGYLEYISPDGSRSHIPLEALDLQRTVSQNAPRGLPFVLRSTPAQNR